MLSINYLIISKNLQNCKHWPGGFADLVFPWRVLPSIALTKVTHLL